MTKNANSETPEDEIKKPNGFLENVKQQIGNNKKKTALLAVMLTAAPIAPILTVTAGVIIAGAVAKTGYKTYKENKAFKQGHLTPKPEGSKSPKGMLGNLGQKILKNKGKALLVVLAATIFPSGTIIAATIIAGTAIKAGLDSYKENKAFKNQQMLKQPAVPTKKQGFIPKPIKPEATPSVQKQTQQQR